MAVILVFVVWLVCPETNNALPQHMNMCDHIRLYLLFRNQKW